MTNDYEDDIGSEDEDDGGGNDEVGGNSDDGVDVPPLQESEYRPTHELVISVNDPADTSKALSSNLSTATLLSWFLSCKCKEKDLSSLPVTTSTLKLDPQ